MGCTVREKPVRANRRIRPVAVRSDPPLSLINRIGLSQSIAESSLKNLVYHPGLTDSGCINSNPSGSNFEENVWGYCTEEHLEEILLKHLEFLYNQTISKLVKLGYEEIVALRAVLSNGHCYGELDVLTNILNNSLSYLNSDSNGNGEDQSETGFTDLKDLEEYSLAGMIYLLQQVKPNLSKGDAMWCLLMSELHVGRASTLDIPIPGNRGSCCTKDDSNVEDDGGSSSTLDIAGFMAPALCRFHGGWDFGTGGGPEFSGNGFSMNGGGLKLQREIVCPKRFNLSPSMKSLLKRNVAAFAAGFRASMKQKEIQSETSGGSIPCNDPARVETLEKPCNEVVSFSSVLEKFRDLNLDEDLESMGEEDKNGVIVNLLHQVKDLEKKLKERKDWAQKKAMQAAQKVSEELTELKSLSSEREGIQLLKKGKQAIEESSVKKLSEMENALRKACSQIDKANAIARALENQNAEIRAEREGSKLSASESNKAYAEATKKEKKCSKKLVAWEKQKLKFQDEITAEKEKIKSLYMALVQITQDEKETEAKWRQEQMAKEQALADFKTMKPCKLADVPGLTEDDLLQPICLAVREPQYTMSGNVEVLVAVGDEIFVVDEDEAQIIRFDEPSVEDSEMQNDDYGNLIGPVQKMIVSPNGKYLTLFTHDGRIVVVGMENKQIAIDYSCESALPPLQMAWCGMDTVLLYWDEDLMMVGPLGDPVHYFYDEPVILIPECDGVRILSNTSLEFLQRVPDSTESIFKIGSTSPAALLYDALDHFDRRSAKADENLRLIRSSLSEAVETCIDAAGHEFDVTRQRALLRAASYGQAFCSNFQRERVQETCRTLRVLNAVRHPDVGIPLSIQQYKLLTPVVLISRLVNAHCHLLALRISEYLDMNKEVVIMHWACAKITASPSTPDAHLLEILLDKLQLCRGISYAAVATHADNCGRRKLAAMLVEHEPRSTKQVPLLLSIGEEDTALVKATESGDTDLVYLVIFHIWQKRPALEFFAMIQGRVLARDLFVAYARCYKHEFLKDFFLSTGQIHEVAFLLWKESWDMGKTPMASKGSPLHGPRIKLIEKARNLFSQTKEHTFESKAAEEHAKLLKIQHELEASTKQAIFVDSSINDTIRTCIVLGNNRAATKVKAEFKVSDKRWYWLKSFALATIKDWEALEKFSKEKRPPTGFRPFVEACIDADEKAEALKYIPKLSDLVERGEAYARIGMAKEAADAAAQANDGGELLERFRKTFSQNAIFDTLKMPFQGAS